MTVDVLCANRRNRLIILTVLGKNDRIKVFILQKNQLVAV